jgi:photosystem II stability/assembly factor-like uncharacterized protein
MQFDPSVSVPPQWQVTHLTFEPNGMWLSPDGRVGWAVGERGQILRLSQGQWYAYPTSGPEDDHYYGVWLNEQGTLGWIVGAFGTILEFKNGEWKVLRLTPKRPA